MRWTDFIVDEFIGLDIVVFGFILKVLEKQCPATEKLSGNSETKSGQGVVQLCDMRFGFLWVRFLAY